MEGEGHAVRCASNGQTALRLAREELPDVVLLDVCLPAADGFEVCRRLKEDASAKPVPVIFRGALEETPEKTQGFAAGGADYLTKPFDVAEALVRARTRVALHRLQGAT